MQTARSPELKGYARFQPMGPNFLRSCTTEWKKQSEKMMALSSVCCPHASHTLSLNELKARSMLGRRPDGGSLVSLIEF
eukprot:4344944-Pleurochrysis_carterae.AAC.2